MTATGYGDIADFGRGGVAVCRAVEERQRIIPPGAAVEGIDEGKVALGWLSGCAFGPFIAAATLTLKSEPRQYSPPRGRWEATLLGRGSALVQGRRLL